MRNCVKNDDEKEGGELLETLLNKEPLCEVVNNRIYFYSDINIETSLNFNKTLRTLTNALLTRQVIEECYDQKIFVHINSGGGEIYSSFSMMDSIVNNKIPVYTICDGFCASGATFPLVVAKKRFMYKNSYVLIHQLSSNFNGTYGNFLDQYKNLTDVMNMMRDIYSKYTTMPKKVIDSIMKKDILLSSDECIEYGIVDEIL